MNISKLAAGIVLAVLWVASVQADTRKPDAEVDLEASNHLVLKAKIGGKDVRLMIDSGSPNCRIQPASAVRLGLVEGGMAEAMKLGVSISGIKMDTDLVVAKAQFMKVTFDVDPIFLDKNGLALDHPDFDGVIGVSFIRKHALGLNLVERKLAIWKDGRLSKEDRESWMGGPPVGEEKLSRIKHGEGEWFGIAGAIGGNKSRFILDIGAPLALMTNKQAIAIDVRPALPINMQFLGANGTGSLAVAPNLEISGRKIPLSWAGVLGDNQKEMEELLSYKGLSGLVGLETFRGTRTVIDFPASKLFCRPESASTSWHDYLGSLGIRVGDDGQGKAVVVIQHDSMAAQAGLETLDVIVEIDGKPVSSDCEWNPPKGQEPSGSLRLKVKRGERILDPILIQLKSELQLQTKAALAQARAASNRRAYRFDALSIPNLLVTINDTSTGEVVGA